MRLKGILKAVLFRFAAIVFGLLIVALLGEVALRSLAPCRGKTATERDRFCRFDHDLGWAPLENITRAESAVLVHQNQFGLRGPDDMQLNKTSGKKRVLVLGDSYVWGYGMDQSKLFSAPEVHGTDEEILNFGVSGYGTDQEYLFYLRKGEKFDVDQVVLAFTPYNDVTNNLASKQYSYLKPYFTLNDGKLVLHNDHVRNSRVRNFVRRLDRECRVWNLVVDGLQGFTNTLLPKRKQQHAERNLVVSDADRAGIELTLALLKKLNETAAARHAEFHVVFIPHKRHVEKHLPENHPFVPLIAASLTQMGVSYREPYPEFLRSAVAGVELFNPRDNHFNGAGHALFAKFVTDTDLARASIDYYAHQ
jgi:hypothetical protein